MFGWEFPPNNLGGLGTACYGLTKSLSEKGTEIAFVLPRCAGEHSHLNIITTGDLYISKSQNLKLTYVDSPLAPYMNSSEYEKVIITKGKVTGKNSPEKELYGKNLFEEVDRYAEKAGVISAFEDFDIIHCHDWMTFKAGIRAKEVSSKPLIVHVHSTDFDRTGGNPNSYVYQIEKEGMEKADRVIAVSRYTKDMITKFYGIPGSKVEVVHNAVEMKAKPNYNSKIKHDDKVVLFLGRLTLQKGPDYFIEAAHRVLQVVPNAKFVVAGSGDMYSKMVNRAAELGIGNKILFTGHLTGEDIDKAYQMADLYVMPSVSEPFGITPLESLRNNTPVLISKQSGVSEVLPNSLKVDFWDIDEMTNKIAGVLAYNSMRSILTENGQADLSKMSWNNAADKCLNVYSNLTGAS
jgi:glycosyltransferase involved in cell wall biosynthesis